MSTPATLNLDNIQGDILQGLPKRHQSFLFFSISNPTLFRQRLKAVIPFITTTTQVQRDEAAIAAHKLSGLLTLLPLVGTNIAFSSAGLKALGINDNLGDTFFSAGQLADASAADGIADPGTPRPDGTVDPAWDPVFKQAIHGCFLITGHSQDAITVRVAELEVLLLGTVKTLALVSGNVRPGTQAGHEHFGFQDGVSQPPVIGFRTPNTGEAPTQPGVILLGEPGDTGTRPTWAKDGSFLAFRKLKQLVPEFHDFLAKNPIPDPGLTPAQGSALLGARLMGRWPSGAPVDRDPVADNAADAADVNKINDFDYSDDPSQVKCPFTAHLRKMNPRAGIPGLAAVQPHRITRQGIPYGPEVGADEASSATTKHDRGLLFTCYQSNLGAGFHFLQKFWASNPNFPKPGVGFDIVIGQKVNDTRTATGMDPQNVTTSLPPSNLFVVPRGGEYFFSPSISALKGTLASADSLLGVL